MMKRRHGPSIYYVTDKNIFDALNQHKVDSSTVAALFIKRNIIVGKKTLRSDLAEYFSALPHDYYDHQAIAECLGVATRRERLTSVDIVGLIDDESLRIAIDQFKSDAEGAGDTVRISRKGSTVALEIEYSTVDYGKSEFAQVRTRDGTVEFVKVAAGYVVRSTKNPHVDALRDSLLGKLDKILEAPIQRVSVDLSAHPDSRVRSKFFYDLATAMPGFSLRDVTGVYVYKPKPGPSPFDLGDDDDDDGQDDHVERVHLRGNGVSRSEFLKELIESNDYYITHIAWRSREILGKGYEYDMEALFADPERCAGFSYLVAGVYHVELGKPAAKRRVPSREESAEVSRVIENRARELVAGMGTSVAPLKE